MIPEYISDFLSAAMLSRQVRKIANLQAIIAQNFTSNSVSLNKWKHVYCLFSTGSNYADLPVNRKKSERKPWVTNINELKRRARQEQKEKQMVHERILRPPENGLLVKELIPVAHEVYAARSELLACVSRVVRSIAVYTCSICSEVHIGHPPHKIRTCNVTGSLTSKEHSWKKGDTEHVLPVVESFHLYDRLGRAVSHNERLHVDRIPAIVELCVQAGLDIPEYPTRRRAFPAYSVAGRITDFERRFPKTDAPGKDINAFGFWHKQEKSSKNFSSNDSHNDDIKGTAAQGMEAWERLRSGSFKLMQKYAVQTCGYCPYVQVGTKGHRVRNCQAYKHQMRDGQHAWQEATVDDLIPPVYVWHVRDLERNRLLLNDLKMYYGMLPAVVELFAQAGARISDDYAGVMREGVAVPSLDEQMFVV